MSIVSRIMKAFSKPTGRGHMPAKILPRVEIRPALEKSDSQEPYIDKPAQKLVNSPFEGQEKWSIEHHARIAETALLTQLDTRGIQLNKISVQVLGLSGRASKRLRTANIDTIQQLVNCAESDLLSIDGLGVITIEEIKSKLNSYLTNMLSGGDRESAMAGMNRGLVEAPLLERLGHQGAPLEKISVQVLGLTPGVLAALKKANIRTIKQLSNCAESDLLGMYHIGVFRVEEIKKSLTSFLGEILVRGNLKEQVRAEAEHIPEQLFQLASNLCSVFENQGLLDDIQLPSQARGKLRKATGEKLETLADLKQLVELHSSETSLFEREEQISTRTLALGQAIVWLNKVLIYKSIDDEVNELVGYLDVRERFILPNRFGVEKHLTLEMIGEQFRVTRERVRQIESRMRDKLVNRIARSSLLYSAAGIALLKRLGEDATADSWKQRLMDIGFLKEKASADLLVAISRVTNSSRLALPEGFDQMLETHVPPHILLARKPVLNKARRFCRNCGAIRIVSLTSANLSEADVEQILCLDGFTEVCSGWWMRKVGECVPERVARKVITSCGPVSPSNLRQALIRHLSRLHFPAPPSEVLVKTLEQTGKFALVDGFLELTKIPTRKPGLTGPESIFATTVHSEGPVISFETVYACLVAEGFSGASVPPLLSRSPIVQKVAFGLYTLLGTQYDAEDVERAKSQLTRVPANTRMKPRSDGVIEFETNIGTWMIYGGVVSSGPAASMEGTWTHIIDGANKGQLVVEGGFIRGLSEAVESLDLMPGDRIRIEFNTWTREAAITKVVNSEQIC